MTWAEWQIHVWRKYHLELMPLHPLSLWANRLVRVVNWGQSTVHRETATTYP